MLIGTPVVVIICFCLGFATFLTLSVVFVIQRNELRNDVYNASIKLQELEQQWDMRKKKDQPNRTDNTYDEYADDWDDENYTALVLPQEPWTDFRLPRDVWPLSYDIELDLFDMGSNKYSGRVAIKLKVLKTTSRIVMHAIRLKIGRVSLLNTCGRLSLAYLKYNATTEQVAVYSNEFFEEGTTINVIIHFTGNFRTDLQGFYVANYRKPNGATKKVMTTQFEATDARSAFPCFDEPDIKAPFNITIKHRDSDDYHALSNMDSAALTYGESTAMRINKFSQSVPMSTYLVCFVISDFLYKEIEVDPKGLGAPFPLRVYSSPHKIDTVDWALNAGKNIFERLIQYFEMEYPLPKMDMIAIPEFAAGAMENWGLITYSEESLLYEEGSTTTFDKQYLTETIAHELAHMWFGNYVTMKWWDHLWLNEGFASFYEMKIVDEIYPEWRLQDQFVSSLESVFNSDDSPYSRPVIKTVLTPQEITDMFDRISYKKGPVLVRMMEDFIGPEKFRRLVRSYIEKFKYRNAVSNDFFSHTAILNLDYDVISIMRTWTEQMGFPVVYVEKLSDTKYNLTQYRYFSDPNNYGKIYKDSPFDYTWSIPITYITSENSEVQRTWFHYNMKSVIIDLPTAVDWIKFNVKAMGLYRVNYAAELWNAIHDVLLQKPDTLSVLDRTSLMNDAFALAHADLLSSDMALTLSKYLEKESDYLALSSGAQLISVFWDRLIGTEVLPDIQRFAQKLIGNAYNSIGWTVGDDHVENLTRQRILTLACKFGIEACLTEASKQFDKFIENPDERPHPDIRQTVYTFGGMNLIDEEKWNKFFQLYVSETDASEKIQLMIGVTAVQDPSILVKLLDLAWESKNVPSSDFFEFFAAIAESPNGNIAAWEYIVRAWSYITKRFGEDSGLTILVFHIVKNFNSQEQLDNVNRLIRNKPKEMPYGFIVRSIVENNMNWVKKNSEIIQNWLKKNA